MLEEDKETWQHETFSITRMPRQTGPLCLYVSPSISAVYWLLREKGFLDSAAKELSVPLSVGFHNAPLVCVCVSARTICVYIRVCVQISVLVKSFIFIFLSPSGDGRSNLGWSGTGEGSRQEHVDTQSRTHNSMRAANRHTPRLEDLSQATDQLQPEEKEREQRTKTWGLPLQPSRLSLRCLCVEETSQNTPQSSCTGPHECIIVHKCVCVCASSKSKCEDHDGLILPDVIHMLVSNGQSNNTHSQTRASSSFLINRMEPPHMSGCNVITVTHRGRIYMIIARLQ